MSVPNYSTIKEWDVDLIYTFSPAEIVRIELRGDEAFRDRITIAPADWVALGVDRYAINIPVGVELDTIRLSIAAGPEAIFDAIRFYLADDVLLTTLQRVR